MPDSKHDIFEADAVSPLKRTWQENHGTLLLFVAGLIAIAATAYLGYSYEDLKPTPVSKPFVASEDPDEVVVEATPENSVVIDVSGAVNDHGMMRVLIFDSESNFNDPLQATVEESGEIINGQSRLLVQRDRLPERFAIVAFHDENSDKILTKNAVGISVERFGFSQNVREANGRVRFEDAVIDRPDVGTAITVYIR